MEVKVYRIGNFHIIQDPFPPREIERVFTNAPANFLAGLEPANPALDNEARWFLWRFAVQKHSEFLNEDASLKNLSQRGGGGTKRSKFMPKWFALYAHLVIKGAAEARIIKWDEFQSTCPHTLIEAERWHELEDLIQKILNRATVSTEWESE